MVEDLTNLLKEADLDLEAKNFDLAQEKLQQIIQLDPQQEVACYKLAQIYAVRGLIGSVVNQYFILMDILEAKGKSSQALEVANQIIKLDPENINARMKSILIYKKQNKTQKVIKLSLILARLLIELGQGDQSILLLQQAQETEPDNLDIGLELAEIYTSYGHIEEAISQYRKIASAFLEKGLLSKAAETYRRLKVIVPDDINILLSLGKIYIDLSRLKEAENEFRTVLRQDLNNIEALMLLGEVCQKKGKFKDAVLAFNKVISINPQEVKTLEKLGELYQEQGKLLEAVKNLLQAAQNYQLLGNIDKAIKLYQKILLSDPTNPVACRQLTNLGAPLAAPEAEPEAPETVPVKAAGIKEEEEVLTTVLSLEEKPEEEKEAKEKVVFKISEEKPLEPVVLVDVSKEAERIHKKHEKIKPRKLVKARMEKKLAKIGLIRKLPKEELTVKPTGLIKVSPEKVLLEEKRGLIKAKIQNKTLMRKTGLIKSKLIAVEAIKIPPIVVPEAEKVISEPKIITKPPEEIPEVLATPTGLVKEKEPKVKITPEEPLVPIPPEEVKERVQVIPEVEHLEVKPSEELIEAASLIQENKISEGISAYNNVLSKDHKNATARSELAKVYLDFGLLSFAKEQYQILIEQQPENLQNYERLSQVLSWIDAPKELIKNYEVFSSVLEKSKDYENLVKVYQKIIFLDKENLDIQEKLAKLYLTLNQTNEAVFHLENLAEQLLKKSKSSKAIEIFNKIFELTKDLSIKERLAKIYEETHDIKSAIKEYLDLACSYKESNMTESAITCFEKVIMLSPEHIDTQQNLIELYKSRGDLDNSIGSMYVLGNVFMKTKDFEKARNLFEDIVKIRPNHLESCNRLVDVYILLNLKEPAFQQANYLIDKFMKDKNYAEAVALYQKLLDYDPENVSLREELSKVYILSQEKEKALQELLNLIKTLQGKEKWDEIVKVYKKALKISPENFDLHYELGLVYLEKLQDIKLATETFEGAFQIDSTNTKVVELLINGYLALQKPSQAVLMLNHLINLEPSFEELKQVIINQYKEKIAKVPDNEKLAYDLGVIYLELNKIDEAIEQFQKTRRYPSTRAKSYNMLGVCFARKSGVGMFDLAIKQFKKVLESEGYPAEEYLQAKYNLASTYESHGMKTEALKYYKEIFKENKDFKDVAEKVKLPKKKKTK